jgi:hypothetical protein
MVDPDAADLRLFPETPRDLRDQMNGLSLDRAP